MSQQLPLAQLVTTMRNGTTADQNDDGRGVPVTRIETISDGTINPEKVRYAEIDPDVISRWRLLPGDILLSHINSVDHIGKSALYDGQPEVLIHGMNLLLLRPDPTRILPAFLHYALRSEAIRSHIRARCKRAVNQASINQKELGSIQVLVPALNEQQKAVDLLSRAENIVRMRREAEKKAKEIIPALFLDMFGDPATNPKGWTAARIEAVATRVTKGESPKWQGFGYVEEGVRFVTSENVRWGELDVAEGKYIPPEFHRKLRRSALLDDDVLINLVGASVGRAACVSGDVLPANINQAVALVTLDRSRCLPQYLLSHLLSDATQRALLGQAVEGARANISLTNIRELQIMLPPLESQARLVERLRRVSNCHVMSVRATVLAADAFQSLLAGVFDSPYEAGTSQSSAK